LAGQRSLALRELNRSTLARQMLLERAPVPVTVGVERLVGLQAQMARPPYVGLWTRLAGFVRDDLARQIEARTVVKATFVRGTLHLLTAGDYLTFRASLQPVLTNALEEVIKGRGVTVDIPRLVALARDFLLAEPRSFAEITTLLTGVEPAGDAGAMRYAVRTHLPLVQVPTSTDWSYPGNPRFALAAEWLGGLPASEDRPAELVKRYLAAFGPASVGDMQTWSYLTDLKPVFDALRDELVVYRLERGREVFDLPGLPIVDGDTPAPVRFLPEFDNVLLAHQDRTRVVPRAYRSKVYLPGLRVAATILIDGFVAGVWTTERSKKQATLIVTPFEAVPKPVRAALEQEGDQLLRFAEPAATTFVVRFAD
jgi:hypothetical protein